MAQSLKQAARLNLQSGADQANPLPVVKGLPGVGALPWLLYKKLDFLEEARRKYGDIYTLKLPLLSMVMLNHPDHAQHVFRDHVRNYTKDGALWNAFRKLTGNALVNSSGDFWLRQRRMMQPFFHRQYLAQITSELVGAIENTFRQWDKYVNEDKAVDLSQVFRHMTMTLVMRTMFLDLMKAA